MQLAPIKMEELHKDPDIYLFYDVANDKNIEKIINFSIPRVWEQNVLLFIYTSLQYRFMLFITQKVNLYYQSSDVQTVVRSQINLARIR